MPNPTPSDLHVNSMLTNVALRYANDPSQFIATQVFPIVRVAKQGDLYRIWDQSDWMRSEARLRAPSTEAPIGGFRVSTDSYYASKYAIGKDIADEDRANADNEFDLDVAATAYCKEQLMLHREKKFISSFFAGSLWTTTVTGAASPTGSQVLQWNDDASDPIGDIDRQRLVVAGLTGRRPNTLVLGPQVFAALKNNADIRDRIKYTQGGVITEQMLAGLFGVDRVLVPWVIENTAKEGLTASYSFLYGKSALLVYTSPNPSTVEPSGGYTFVWSGLMGSAPDGIRIKKFRMEAIESDRIEGETAYDMKLTGAGLGVWFATIVA